MSRRFNQKIPAYMSKVLELQKAKRPCKLLGFITFAYRTMIGATFSKGRASAIATPMSITLPPKAITNAR